MATIKLYQQEDNEAHMSTGLQTQLVQNVASVYIVYILIYFRVCRLQLISGLTLQKLCTDHDWILNHYSNIICHHHLFTTLVSGETSNFPENKFSKNEEKTL